MIKGRTIIKREIVNFPRGEVVIGTIPAGTKITATENVYQWLHLAEGGWVNAGARQQYIQWRFASDPVAPEPGAEAPEHTLVEMIKGKAIIKREIVNIPRGEVVIGTIPAGTEITATENVYQWLHLAEGGWVNAGARQQYIQWRFEKVPVGSGTADEAPAPGVTRPITKIKRRGRIATLLVDWQNPKWNYEPRQAWLKGAYPHTVTFNAVRNPRKGPRIPLREPVLEYLERLNGERVTDLILEPHAGWINRPTTPPSVERLTWAGNHVVVTETAEEQGVTYANVYASDCHANDLEGTFFEKDMRLIVHKFNAITWKRIMIKLRNQQDCYTPLITDPNVNDGGMWIRSDYLEMWPALPFTLSDGSRIVEYELHGFKIYGLRQAGGYILLRDTGGFKTNWRIKSPEVPY